MAALDLTPEDYLTIRLYSNNDAGNILWEWAFEFLAIDTLQDIEDRIDEETGDIKLTANNPVLDLQAILIGYMDRDPEKKMPLRLTWIMEGDGAVNPVTQTSTDLGIFNTTLTMPNSVGARGTLKAKLDNGGDVTEVVFGNLEVVPGEPANITIAATGEANALGVGEINATATVVD